MCVVVSQVGAEAELEPDVYTLIVSTYHAGCEGEFVVTVYSEKPLRNTDRVTEGFRELRRIPLLVPAA